MEPTFLFTWNLLKMFKYTKKIVIAASLLAFYSGQLYAMNPDGTDDEDNQPKRTAVVATTGTPESQHGIIRDVLKLIFAEASKSTHPRRLAAVCRHWNSVMRENSPVNRMGVPYANLNPFMQACMNTYWENRFYNGVLQYNPPQNGAIQDLRFSDLDDPFKGTFNLQGCGNVAGDLVITTDPERFFKIRGENEDRVVILIALRHLIEQAINSTEAHPLVSVMDSWNADEAPAGIFWRWGNYQDLTWFDYLTVRSWAEISSTNLFENWKKRRRGRGECAVSARTWMRCAGPCFHVRF